MSAASPTITSFEDYLAAEASSDVKHEWRNGVVYAMSRGTPEHARLTARMIQILGAALDEKCAVYSPDMMLYVELAKLSTYADASVVRGSLETKTVRKNGKSLGEAVTNPAVIVEVLSEATERYDRDAKFQAYARLASLEEYVLVSQDTRFIEVYRRDGETWRVETGGPGASVTIHGAVIDVDRVYA